MGKKELAEEFEELEKLYSQIQEIALVDEEAYTYFKDRIFELKEKMMVKQDDYAYQVDSLKKLTDIKYDIKQYMQNGIWGEYKPKIEIRNSTISGIDKIKQYRIHLYQKIADNMQNDENLDIEKLAKVKNDWEKESDSQYGYTDIEKRYIKGILTGIFIEYQIRYVQNNHKLPETNIEDYCDSSIYSSKLRGRLLDKIKQLPEKTPERISLEDLYTSWDENALTSSKLWEVISDSYVEEKLEKNENTTSLVPMTPKQQIKMQKKEQKMERKIGKEIKKGHIVFVAETSNMMGKKNLKLISQKITENGDTNFTINAKIAEKIVEAYIPNQVKKVSPNTFNHYESYGDESFLMSLNNLKAVHLPENLVEIENKTFRGNRQLEQINWPESLKRIGDYAFAGTKIKTANLPDGVEEIGEGAFCNHKMLRYDIDNVDEEYLEKIESETLGRENVVVPRGFVTCITRNQSNELGSYYYRADKEIQEKETYHKISKDGKINFHYDSHSNNGSYFRNGVRELYFPENAQKISESSLNQIKQFKNIRVLDLPNTLSVIEDDKQEENQKDFRQKYKIKGLESLRQESDFNNIQDLEQNDKGQETDNER